MPTTTTTDTIDHGETCQRRRCHLPVEYIVTWAKSSGDGTHRLALCGSHFRETYGDRTYPNINIERIK